MFPVRKSFRQLHPLPRRIVSLGLLVLMAVAIVGVPVSPPPVGKIGRFPCEDCPCGCSTADFCWDKCCCHTDSEKLDWARRNGVSPPEFLVRRARQADHSTRSADAGEVARSAGSCCCCKSVAAKEPAESCDVRLSPGVEEQSRNDEARASRRRIVRLEDAARCRGIEMVWSVLAQASVHGNRGLSIVDPPRLIFWIALEDRRATGRPEYPDPPVPWRA